MERNWGIRKSTQQTFLVYSNLACWLLKMMMYFVGLKEKLKKLWITISFTKSNQYSNLRQSKWCPFGTEICRIALKAQKFLSTYVMTSEVKFELYWKTWTMCFLPLPLCENLNLRFMEFSLLMERVYVTAATVLGKTLLPSPACTLQVGLATSRNLCW